MYLSRCSHGWSGSARNELGEEPDYPDEVLGLLHALANSLEADATVRLTLVALEMTDWRCWSARCWHTQSQSWCLPYLCAGGALWSLDW